MNHRTPLSSVIALALATAACVAFAQAQVVPPAVRISISGPRSGTNPVNPAPSGFHKRIGDATDNRGSTSFGQARVAGGDDALLASVVSALQSDPTLEGAALQVEVLDGIVGITGHAADSAQAERARRIAAQAANGARIETDIDVQ